MQLRRLLRSYTDYYNSVRTHRSLNNDALALAGRPPTFDHVLGGSFGTNAYRSEILMALRLAANSMPASTPLERDRHALSIAQLHSP